MKASEFLLEEEGQGMTASAFLNPPQTPESLPEELPGTTAMDFLGSKQAPEIGALEFLSSTEKEQKQQPGFVESVEREIPWKARHPNLYALGMTPVGTAKELSKASWLKYIYEEEREKFSELPPVSEYDDSFFGGPSQTRQLLWDTLEAVTLLGAKPIVEGGSALIKRYFPSTYKLFTTPIGKGKQIAETVPQKILRHKKDNKGEMPPKEQINKWWGEAADKADIKKKPATPIQEEQLPKYAQSVNLEKQNIPTSAKRLELEMEGVKKTQTWDETGKLSDKILSDMDKTEQALKKVKGLEGLTENMEAVRQANVNQISSLGKLAEDFKTGIVTEEEFNKAFVLARDKFFKVTSEGSSEIGRALNVHKKMLSETDHLAKGLANIEGKLKPDQIKDFADIVKGGNPAKMARFAAELKDPKLKDYVLEYWYNSILSGPPTHAVNMVSNTLWYGYQYPHRIHTALWDKLYSGLTGKEREFFMKEVVPMMAGYKSGWKRGAKGAMETVRTGKIQDFETKWAQEMGLSSVAAWERSPSKAMRTVAPIVSAPTRALRAMDVWANSIGYDTEMMAFATRQGMKKNLKGDKLKEFINDFVKKPSSEAHEYASSRAKHNTFMDDPDKFTDWFLGVRKVPVIGPVSQFIVPFVNTIGNLTKRGLEFTPGGGVAKEDVSRKMGRGMSNPELIAKQVEGAVLSLYVMHKTDMGEMTGAAPESEAERERFYAQGKKPWAIRLGDTWVSYRRIEPFNSVMASSSIAYDKIKNAKDEDTATKIFFDITKDVKDNLMDSSYFQGLQQIFNRHQKLEKAPQRTAASLVPYSSFWRSMNRAYEKATEGEVTVKGDSWLSSFAQVIPGLSDKVPSKLTIWGDEKVIPGSVLQHWLPYKWSKETQDPVEIELERLNTSLKDDPSGLKVFPGQPSQTIRYRDEKHKIPDDKYRDYLIDLGRELRTQYERTMNSKSYQSRTNTQKAKILNKRTAKARNKIRNKLIREIYRRQ